MIIKRFKDIISGGYLALKLLYKIVIQAKLKEEKRITIVTQDFYPLNAGVANATLAFSIALVKYGFDVDVIVFNQDNALKKKEIYKGVNVTRVYKEPDRWFYDQVLKTLIAISETNSKIVLSQMIGLPGLISGLSSKFLSRKSMTMAHGSDVDEVYTEQLQFITKKSMLLNDLVLVTNTDFKDKIKKLWPPKGKVLLFPNVFVPPQITQTRSALRKKFKLDNNKFHLVSVGRLVRINGIETKGISYVIRAMPKLKKAVLHIFGNGPLKDELVELSKKLGVEKQVIFHKPVPNKELLSFFKAADALAFTGLTEGLSMTQLETMSQGLPMIATSIGGAKDYIKDGQNGLIVRKKSPEDIINAVKSLQNSKRWKKISKAAKETYLNNFTEKNVIRRYEQLLGE